MDQRKERIKEIDKLRDELAKERDALRNEILKEEDEKIINSRIQYVGKCFKLNKFEKSKAYPNIDAFMILELVESGSSRNYARCLTLCNGYRYTAWEEVGITNQVLALWSPDIDRMISSPRDRKTIELFKEISKEEFDELLKERLEISKTKKEKE